MRPQCRREITVCGNDCQPRTRQTEGTGHHQACQTLKHYIFRKRFSDFIAKKQWKNFASTAFIAALSKSISTRNPPLCVLSSIDLSVAIDFSQTWLRYVWLFTFGYCYRKSVCRLYVCRLWRACTLLRGFNFSGIFLHHIVAWPSGATHPPKITKIVQGDHPQRGR